MKKTILFSLMICFLLGFSKLNAQIFSEDFSGGSIPGSFILINNDGLTPDPAVSFVNAAWVVRDDFDDPTDKVACSNSWYSPVGTADDWMIIPNIALPASPSGTLFLTWNAIAPDPNYADGYEVKISTTGTNMGDFSMNLLTIPSEVSTWIGHSVDLSAYVGQTIHLAFRNNSTDKFLLFIDDIVVADVVNYDLSVTTSGLSEYAAVNDNVTISGTLTNMGSQTITSLTLNYSIDGGSAVTDAVTGLSISQLGTYSFAHSTPWMPSATGSHTVEMWATNINGNPDQNTSNDMLSADVYVAASLENLIVLVEEVTQWNCPPCFTQNPAFDALLLANSLNVAAVKYHGWWPGANDDPMYLFAEAANDARINYYAVNGAPTGIMNGVYITNDCGAYDGAPACLSQADLNVETAKKAPFKVEITQSKAGSTVTVDVKVTSRVLSSSNYQLRVAVTEDLISYNPAGTNGEVDFTEPMRYMLPNANGTQIGPFTVDGEIDNQFTYTIDPSFTEDLHVVAWIQDDGTKSVLQVGKDAIFTGIQKIEENVELKLYPNPFKDQLNVSYSLKSGNDVTVDLYNMLGEVVYSIDNGYQSVGNYNLQIDGSEIATGLYYLNLNVGGEVITTKVTVN